MLTGGPLDREQVGACHFELAGDERLLRTIQ